jgi:DnaK suppressor protein
VAKRKPAKKAKAKTKTAKKAKATKKKAPKVKKAPGRTAKAKTTKGKAAKGKTTKAKTKTTKRKKLPPPPPLKAVKTPLIPIILDDGSVADPGEKPKQPRKRKLNPAQIKEIRTLLLKRRTELLDEIREEIGQSQQGVKQRSADPTDQASDSADGDLALMLAQSDSEELGQVEAALERIDAGEVGTCEECGAPIPMERLRALPYATACIDCKRRSELKSGGDNLEEAWEAVHNSEEEKGGDDD